MAALVGNNGSVTCEPGLGPTGADGSRCHMAFRETKYPSLKDCHNEAPAILKNGSPFADVTITWHCEKYDPEAERIQAQKSIILRHDSAGEQP